jgi:hypothetical protein
MDMETYILQAIIWAEKMNFPSVERLIDSLSKYAINSPTKYFLLKNENYAIAANCLEEVLIKSEPYFHFLTLYCGNFDIEDFILSPFFSFRLLSEELTEDDIVLHCLDSLSHYFTELFLIK